MSIQALEAPQEASSHAIRSVPQTYAQYVIDNEQRAPVYETEHLKLWHVPAHVGRTAFTIAVVISDQGATFSVSWAYREHLDALLLAEMNEMPMVTPIKTMTVH